MSERLSGYGHWISNWRFRSLSPMATHSAQPVLPPRMEAEFSTLLHKLSASSHQAHTLIGQTNLPRWCRRPLFFFLGYIAKSEGRVSEQDIGCAENLMTALRLSKRQRHKAISKIGRASCREKE